MKRNRRDFLKATAVGATGAVLADFANEDVIAQSQVPKRWDREVDVVVVGSGATGMPAAIAARQKGASVIIVEANYDVGGHAIICTGNVALGGGSSAQKKAGIVDSPDLLYSDLTDWSIVEPNGFPDYRYNDKEIMRAFADESAPTYEFLVAAGVPFADRPPDNSGAGNTGNSAPREMHTLSLEWPLIQTGKPSTETTGAFAGASGIGLIRPLEATARKIGVEILLKHRMTAVIREQPFSGRVVGITVATGGKTLSIRARKGVIIGTGGSTGNVNFRRIFDPTPDRGIRQRGRALHVPRRQRRDRRDGHRRVALGHRLPDERGRAAPDHAGLPRLPIRVSLDVSDVAADVFDLQPRAGDGHPGGRSPGHHPRQQSWPAVLQRERQRGLHAEQLRPAEGLRAAQLAQRDETHLYAE